MTLYIDTRPQLEWEGNYASICDYGLYQIAESKPHGKFRAIILSYNNEVEWCSIIYDTLDQAKDAAQADYEARTADRFTAVEVPDNREYFIEHNADYVDVYNKAIDDIHEAIAKAKLPESLHTKP